MNLAEACLTLNFGAVYAREEVPSKPHCSRIPRRFVAGPPGACQVGVGNSPNRSVERYSDHRHQVR